MDGRGRKLSSLWRARARASLRRQVTKSSWNRTQAVVEERDVAASFRSRKNWIDVGLCAEGGRLDGNRGVLGDVEEEEVGERSRRCGAG